MDHLKNKIDIFTDGSCNPVFKIGGWAAILLFDEEEILLQGNELESTHNRMELLSVIKALEYIEKHNLVNYSISIHSDSQYVVKLIDRKNKLVSANFLTKKGSTIPNKDLVEKIFYFIDSLDLGFVKVKAHEKKSDLKNFNRDVDKISRKIVREYVRGLAQD
ncbi:MAG: hypothetical protein GY754_34260 [bacterium]|nr:hypothetical protein [bacterium]